MTMGRRISIDDDVVTLQGEVIRNLRNTLGAVLEDLEEARRHAAALQRLVIELQGRLEAGGKAPGHVRTPGASITMAVAPATSGPL
jgi:hypothetical protein